MAGSKLFLTKSKQSENRSSRLTLRICWLGATSRSSSTCCPSLHQLSSSVSLWGSMEQKICKPTRSTRQSVFSTWCQIPWDCSLWLWFRWQVPRQVWPELTISTSIQRGKMTVLLKMTAVCSQVRSRLMAPNSDGRLTRLNYTTSKARNWRRILIRRRRREIRKRTRRKSPSQIKTQS